MGDQLGKLLAVIRIRGTVGVHPDIRHTLRLLRLTRKFHMILVRESPSIKGMLHKVKDYVTYGEISKDTLRDLIAKRGRGPGNVRITDEYLRKKSEFSTIEELADAIYSGKADIRRLKFIKPVFRLHPPRGGFKKTTKRHVTDKGELGYRGEAINKLIRRML
uniref:Large ribosomal subunit protein uL30 n=1 Tax=uncultured korarchaeote TaxID=161241 RepID=A0A1L2JK00_9CREN|nr:ribosomal protein L30/L7E [uncultured korarchaeote]